MKVKFTQPCLTLGNSLDYSLPDSSVHGILQARILEWVAFPFSRGSSQPRDQTQVSSIADRFFTIWSTREPLYQNPMGGIALFFRMQKLRHRVKFLSKLNTSLNCGAEASSSIAVLSKISISMRRMVPRVNSCLLCQDLSWNEKNICTVPWIKCAILHPRPQMAITQRFITSRWLQNRSKTQVRVVHLRPTQQSKVISHPHSKKGIKFQSRSDYVFPQSFW